MKDVTMFMQKWCPHCRKASTMIEVVRGEKEEYKQVKITPVDENKEKQYADKFDYYLVPTFYVDGEKAHEGAVKIEDIRNVFERAIL